MRPYMGSASGLAHAASHTWGPARWAPALPTPRTPRRAPAALQEVEDRLRLPLRAAIDALRLVSERAVTGVAECLRPLGLRADHGRQLLGQCGWLDVQLGLHQLEHRPEHAAALVESLLQMTDVLLELQELPDQ